MKEMSSTVDRPHSISSGSFQRHAEQDYQAQARRLGQYNSDQENEDTGATKAAQAKFITAQDPVIQTVNGGRLPSVPLEEAIKLNILKDQAEGREPKIHKELKVSVRESKDGTIHGIDPKSISAIKKQQDQRSQPEAPLSEAIPQTRTNPLFPPLPLWGPPSLLRDVQCVFLQVTSAILSFLFLLVIVLGALFTDIPDFFISIWERITLRDPGMKRQFHEEEVKRSKKRQEDERAWLRNQNQNRDNLSDKEKDGDSDDEQFLPTEGGPDKLVCDVGYYARRVGLDSETFFVQTEDGFIIELWHIFNPRDCSPAESPNREIDDPEVFPPKQKTTASHAFDYPYGRKKYPVLLIHGLLQSAGSYCCNDDSSLAFYLAKSGYDVWLGNNRCGFNPQHTMLKYSDPRMWAWNIRQMGVIDLPALISRVLAETGFKKLGLVAHSQGTTQTLVALAKEQRPDIGKYISVFCALAPAAYAGPLIGKAYFKFMHVVPPALFRCIFGIHAFIPFMMNMHKLLPSRMYGYMGYRIFSFLFNWTDARWERALRDRYFIFAPVYVSAESMRWWLGRECFARQKCILATREEGRIEDDEDNERNIDEDYYKRRGRHPSENELPPPVPSQDVDTLGAMTPASTNHADHVKSTKSLDPSTCSSSDRRNSTDDFDERSRYAWYDSQVPPMAFWVAGSDDLVDGRRLLRRFKRGREPHVAVVHAKVIPDYEHLDVIWAMDSIEQVGKEVKEVIWKTTSAEDREACRTPKGCENIEIFKKERGDTSALADIKSSL